MTTHTCVYIFVCFILFFAYYVMFYSAQLDLVSNKHRNFDVSILNTFFNVYTLQIQLASQPSREVYF